MTDDDTDWEAVEMAEMDEQRQWEDHRDALAAAEARGVERGRTEAAEVIARLEAERDEARARANEAARLSAEARDQADDLRRLIADLREEIAVIDESRTDMTVIQLRLEAERDDYRRRLHFAEVTAGRVAQERDEALRLERQAAHELGLTVAERDSWRRVSERLEAEKVAALDQRDRAVAAWVRWIPAAVDQTAPSSPLETPHTADGGEAGVVEGAGGSEAAEADERPELLAFVEDCLGVTLTPWQRDLLVPKPEGTDA